MTSCRFLKSAVLPQDYPPDQGVEIAIAGRSNAGKSSLINLLTGSRIAKVSSTPGKTRLLNFFLMNGKYVLTDMPGYGFAARSKSEIEEWEEMIESYLSSRESLRGLILVIDSRREWADEEQALKNFTEDRGLPMAIALTKTDKLSKNEIFTAVAKMKKAAGLENVFPMSTLKKVGHKELEDFAFLNWVKPHLGKGKS